MKGKDKQLTGYLHSPAVHVIESPTEQEVQDINAESIRQIFSKILILITHIFHAILKKYSNVEDLGNYKVMYSLEGPLRNDLYLIENLFHMIESFASVYLSKKFYKKTTSEKQELQKNPICKALQHVSSLTLGNNLYDKETNMLDSMQNMLNSVQQTISKLDTAITREAVKQTNGVLKRYS